MLSAVPRHLPAAILLVSLLLRLALAAQGGQYFFGDEGRYDRGLQLYRALASADFSGVSTILAQPEHALFPWVGALVTAAQHTLAHLTPFGNWSHPENIGFTIGIAAAVLSLFSTLNLLLLHRLALRAGASPEEAAWALLLMAAANSAFYFSRHLLPYDCALTAGLAALVVALGRPTLPRAWVAGLLTGATYHLYNGYWFLVPVLTGVIALAWRNQPARSRLTVAAATGLLLALATPVALGALLGGANYWATLGAFSRSVTQGLFAEGWSLPWEYFWHAEGLLGAGLALVVTLALFSALRTREPLPDRVRVTLLALAAAYALWVAASCGFARLVVYARTLKPLVPALCLLGGWAVARLVAPRPILKPCFAAALVLAAALHFAPHFTRVFPREIELALLRAWGNPKHALTIAGSLYIPLALPVTRPDLALVNAQVLYPARAALPPPAGTTLLRFDHPLAYPPFQYEGHTPRERALLRTTDLSICLIRLAAPATVPDHPPPDLLYRDADRPTGR